jgi:hypothetical protein
VGLRLHHAPLVKWLPLLSPPSLAPTPVSSHSIGHPGHDPPRLVSFHPISLYLASLEFHWTPYNPPPVPQSIIAGAINGANGPSSVAAISSLSAAELWGWVHGLVRDTISIRMVKRGGPWGGEGLARTHGSSPAIHTISVAFRLSPDRSFEKFKMFVLLHLVWAAAR